MKRKTTLQVIIGSALFAWAVIAMIQDGGKFNLLAVAASLLGLVFAYFGNRRGIGWIIAAVLLSFTAFIVLREIRIEWTLASLTTIWLATAFGAFGARFRGVAVLAFNAALICLVAGALEFLASISGSQAQWTDKWSGPMFKDHPKRSRVNLPGAVVGHQCFNQDGEKQFDVTYHIDAEGNRPVPAVPEKGDTWRLFGASYLFGYGITEDETIAAQLQAMVPSKRIVNHGVGGYGTADAYLTMQEQLADDQESTACMYFMIADHFRRTDCPDELLLVEFNRTMPRFELRNGKLELLGHAQDTMSPANILNFNLLSRSFMYRAIASKWKPTPELEQLMTELIVGMKKSCETRPERTFILVMLPQDTYSGEDEGHKQHWVSSSDQHDMNPWFETLRARDVKIIDLRSRFWEYLKTGEHQQSDYFHIEHHPKPKAAKLWAKWLAEELTKQDLITDQDVTRLRQD